MESASTYNFFLSYANEEPNELVEQFFKDLCGEVCRRAGIKHTEAVGFLDRRNIKWGTEWGAELVEALNRCQVFVALCSPLYFASEACGREWWLFEERLRLHREGTGLTVPRLLPVWWLPAVRAKVPDRAWRLQFGDRNFDATYQLDGLRQLLQLRDRRDSYIRILSALSQRIVDVAEGVVLPRHPGPHDYFTMPNAFAGAANSGGPGYVHFVVAAPSRAEISARSVRKDLWYYGDSRLDWAPYRNATGTSLTGSAGRTVAESARAVAAAERFHSGTASFDELAERMAAAQANNQLVTFLVDPWSTELLEHRRVLAECDRADGSPVLIPSYSDDAETQVNWHTLTERLRAVFAKRYTWGDARTFRSSVLTEAAFDADLRVALRVAQNQMHQRGTPRPDLPRDESPAAPPRLGIS